MHITKKNLRIYKNVETDSEGYLKKAQDWNAVLAKEIAKKEDINLNSDHWIIINFIRKFYLQFNITPSTRMLIKGIKKDLDKSKNNSIYLFKLFPKGPAQQASKIAGLPKPVKCL